MNVGNRIFDDKLVTWGFAPGYRDISMTVALNDGSQNKRQIELHFDTAQAAEILRALWEVHECAWRLADGPIDKQPHELRPDFVNCKRPPFLGFNEGVRERRVVS